MWASEPKAISASEHLRGEKEASTLCAVRVRSRRDMSARGQESVTEVALEKWKRPPVRAAEGRSPHAARCDLRLS